MLKMKLPTKMGEEKGDETAEDDSLTHLGQQHIPGAAPPSSGSDRLDGSPRPYVCPSYLDKEAVFEWFGLHLNPARRIEFMCGLLHMCQPLELRFLGSYLEDLARKDNHVLRDFEFRANSPNDLGLLTDVVDPVVMSKLLVCLCLLGSDSTGCAGILFRTLSHVDPTLFSRKHDYSFPPCGEPLHPQWQDGNVYGQSFGLSANETAAGPLEQLALLFTMASLHPAFHFHQREKVRGQLDKIERAMEERRQSHLKIKAQAKELMDQKVDRLPSPASLGDCVASHPPCQSRRFSRWTSQREAVHIERIVLRGIFRTWKDKEYNFEVKWSDSSSSSVTKTHMELENFLLKLPKDQCTESFEKSILRLLNQWDQNGSRDVERNLRERFLSAPPAFRQTRKVCSFFNCDASHSAKPTCYRCHYQLGKAYRGDCSASSQEEDLESRVQGHKKKHGTKSPCQGLSSAKGPQGEGRRGGPSAELNGPAERRKSSTLRSGQEAEQHADTEKRSHPTTKAKNRGPPIDWAKGKGGGILNNGRLAPALLSHRKDTFGDTSSESYSSPSSPQHRPASLDSDEENNKDTDSHSEDSSKGPGRVTFFTHQTDPAVEGEATSAHRRSSRNQRAQMQPFPAETDYRPPSLSSFMHSLPYMLPNGVAEPPLPLAPPSNQSVVLDVKPHSVKPPSVALMTQMPPSPSAATASGVVGESEKRDVLPTFGIPPTGLHPSGNPAVQPMVQRFKTASPHSHGGSDGALGSGSASGSSPAAPPAAHQVPIRAVSLMVHGPSSYSTPLQSLPCQDPAPLPRGEPPHTKHLGLTLPPALPPPYSLPCTPTSVGATPAAGHVQAAAAPAVPTHTPGPAPSPSPALTHSTAHSDCTLYSNSCASCGSPPVIPGKPLTVQQTQQQQLPPQQPQKQRQPMGCGTCGCHNDCEGQVSVSSSVSGASACQAPLFYPAHQMAAARQVFSVPPPLFHLTSLCSTSYLSQAQPPHQNNAAATLSPFFSAAPPAHPPHYGPLQTHAHSHTDVSHIVGTQAAAAAAANYSLQQQMVPAASFCQRIYQQHLYPNPLGLLPAAALGVGGVNKKSGNVTCYNCGVSGHYAHECSQPSIDATQQGGFRLKYRMSEALDNGE